MLAVAVTLAGPLPAAGWELPSAVRTAAGDWREAGQARLTFLGFQVYDAKLWVAPGFQAAALERHAFALELRYLRDFRAADIARRSIEEMRQAEPLAAADAERWQAQLRAVLPDVRAGDRILGLHRPGVGAQFLVNGRPAGEIADPAFARRFFAIWLGPRSSEPALRQQLLAGAAP